MKIATPTKNFFLYALIFLINHNATAILFSILAQKEGLYGYLSNLRNKTSNHLDDILSEMHDELRILKTTGRLVKADYMQDLYQQIFYKYSDRIDMAFGDLNQMMVLDGGKLDFYGVLNQQKLDLIDEIKLEANRTVLPLLSISFSELKRSHGLSNTNKTPYIKSKYWLAETFSFNLLVRMP